MAKQELDQAALLPKEAFGKDANRWQVIAE